MGNWEELSKLQWLYGVGYFLMQHFSGSGGINNHKTELTRILPTLCIYQPCLIRCGQHFGYAHDRFGRSLFYRAANHLAENIHQHRTIKINVDRLFLNWNT